MRNESDKQNKIGLGITIIIGFHILNLIMFVVGQGGAVVAYDTVASWGLQEATESTDPFIILINQSIGLADFIIGVPLFILAILGLWRKQFWGFVSSWMVFGISLYWTSVAWSKQSYYHTASLKCEAFDIGTHIILAFVFLFSLWGSWYLYKKRAWFV